MFADIRLVGFHPPGFRQGLGSSNISTAKRLFMGLGIPSGAKLPGTIVMGEFFRPGFDPLIKFWSKSTPSFL